MADVAFCALEAGAGGGADFAVCGAGFAGGAIEVGSLVAGDALVDGVGVAAGAGVTAFLAG